MIAVYGAVPEFFETQEAAIKKFSTPNSGIPNSRIDVSYILIVVTGIIIVSALWYYSYQISEEKKTPIASRKV